MTIAFDLFIGRASARHDMRYRYGYSRAGADAVLDAFSHDDTTFSTKQDRLAIIRPVARQDRKANAASVRAWRRILAGGYAEAAGQSSMQRVWEDRPSVASRLAG